MTTSLDDLLRHEEPVPLNRPSESLGRFALRIVWHAGVLAAATYGILRLSGHTMPPVLLFASFAAILLIWRAAQAVAEPLDAPVRDLVRRQAGARDNRPTWYPGQDGVIHALRRWESRLVWSATSSDRFVQTLPRHLGEVVDERLRQRHGITRASDPDRARAACGEQLWTFLHEPARYRPSRAVLTAMITEMERL
jgi:hypothetical protein